MQRSFPSLSGPDPFAHTSARGCGQGCSLPLEALRRVPMLRRAKGYLRMKNLITAAVLACSTAVPAAADSFLANRGVRVLPVNDLVYEVVPGRSGGTWDYWCAAAQYARRVLGANWTDRFYVVRGRDVSVTTGRRSSVQFTLYPEQAGVPPKTGWLSLGFRPGESLSVQQGYGYCVQAPAL